MFGFQRRLVRRCEWDTLWPKPGPLPQTSHTLATGYLLGFDCQRKPRQRPGNRTRLPERGRHDRRNRARQRACAELQLSPRRINVMPVLDRLDAAAVRRWCAAGLDALRRHQVEIDQLNVYPVPDGDTGTNLVLTVGLRLAGARGRAGGRSRARDARSPGCGRGRCAAWPAGRCWARGQLRRDHFRRSCAAPPTRWPSAPAARGRALAEALTVAAKAGYAAVAEPVEGTVLSVATAAAVAATAADTDDLATVVRAAAERCGRGPGPYARAVARPRPGRSRGRRRPRAGRPARRAGGGRHGAGSRRRLRWPAVARDPRLLAIGAGDGIVRVRVRGAVPARRRRRCGRDAARRPWPGSATRSSWSAPAVTALPTWNVHVHVERRRARRSRRAWRPAARTGSR